MNTGITKLFEDAESLMDARRLLPAVQTLEEARRLTRIPDRRAWASYNLGSIHWSKLGDGPAARREYLACIADFDAHGYGQRPQFKVMHANALENAMLCALSFDEFENLAARLAVLLPGVPILTTLVPEVKNLRERGSPWYHQLFNLADTYYNRNDPSRDVGRYGEARATYHLLLIHRRELRLSREDWRLAVFELCALSMRMTSDCIIARGGEGDPNPPDEFLGILTGAIALAEEYLQTNTGDGGLKKTFGDLNEMVYNLQKRWESAGQRSKVMAHKTEFQKCQKCGKVYARRDIDGSDFIIAEMRLHDRPTMCLKCGGNVVWQSTPETRPGIGGGCLPVLLLLGFLAGTAILWLK